jgi:dihydroorotase
MNIVIKGGYIIDPVNKVEGKFDLLIADGKITKLGRPGSLPANGAEIIDASGRLVVPGLIDMHVHLREPGRDQAIDNEPC